MKTQQAQVKIQFGKCPFCEKEIMKQVKNQAIKLDGYSEFWLSFGTGERMKVAICADCKKSLTKKQADEILEAHKNLWKDGIEKTINLKVSQLNKAKTDNLNYYDNLSLASWGLKEKDLE